MNRHLPFSRRAPALTIAIALALATMSGCVDRRFVIDADPQGVTSCPPGTICYVNDQWVGPAPTDVQFTYYGKYRFVFVRDGYETLTVDEQIRTPWWSYFPLEFVVESLWPWNIRDQRIIRKPLVPQQNVPVSVTLQRANEIRGQGQLINPRPVVCVPTPAAGGMPPGPVVPPPGTAAVPPPPSSPGFVPVPLPQ